MSKQTRSLQCNFSFEFNWYLHLFWSASSLFKSRRANIVIIMLYSMHFIVYCQFLCSFVLMKSKQAINCCLILFVRYCVPSCIRSEDKDNADAPVSNWIVLSSMGNRTNRCIQTIFIDLLEFAKEFHKVLKLPWNSRKGHNIVCIIICIWSNEEKKKKCATLTCQLQINFGQFHEFHVLTVGSFKILWLN